MKYFWLNILSVSSVLAEISSAQDTCDAKSDVKCDREKKIECDGKIELQDIQDVTLGEDNIFFIESSPKEVLSSREGCALESAARNSGLMVVMVRVGRSLDLRDNTTCQIYSRHVSDILFHVSHTPRYNRKQIIAIFISGSETPSACIILILINFQRTRC